MSAKRDVVDILRCVVALGRDARERVTRNEAVGGRQL